ncbi:MAG: hypothetical protein QW828_07005, partial [Candidatus Bathyarchaeia archaeon]
MRAHNRIPACFAVSLILLCILTDAYRVHAIGIGVSPSSLVYNVASQGAITKQVSVSNMGDAPVT